MNKEINKTNNKKAGRGNGCPLYKKCGGCQLQNMSYDEQLSFKQAKCIRHLKRFGHVEEILGMARPLHYRNKVQAAFGVTRGGKIISGVYQSASHRIVCVDDCLLEDETADRIIVSIRALLPQFKLRPYDEDKGTGFLRHVLVRRGFATGEVMVVLVTPSALFPGKKAFLKQLLHLHPEITTVIQSINGAKTSLVLGKQEITLFGKGFIEDVLCNRRFRISARSFYQINPVQTEVLYNQAMEFAALTGEETVLDAYCGIGTIGLVAAEKAKRVIGVELNADAVRDAKQNAKLNGISNASFLCADAGKFMTEAAQEHAQVDVVFMDPPRAGSDLAFLRSLVTLGAKKIVYISCNVETQARDLGFLVKNGYTVKKIQPVDMFPHTGHVECVVLLSQRRATEHIDIKLDLTDLDLTAAETKPTYDDIKAYVLKTYGLKVSTLYISQVKRKLGLEVGEAYCKPKSDKYKTPQCPEEKEQAIVAALRYFKMI
ncbi:MAG: 23S rRNA (uracil(1939)-C(5))-methyltransferase RlmD [Clostridia bacterium]|nr:23S rRNA (uracil(1939)-C(5))-methyltransferase RlmD [Clostridia bacterium]